MTADDTFRILKRKPLSEIYHTIAKKSNEDMAEDRFRQIVESYNYTLEEFYDYDEDYVRRKILHWRQVATK